MIKRGEIYLANLNPKKGKEVGKLRPVLVIQTEDMLNEVSHPTVIVLPLSTQLIDDVYPLRFRIKKRDKLERETDILCDQIRAIDVCRISSQALTVLTEEEMLDIENRLEIILGCI